MASETPSPRRIPDEHVAYATRPTGRTVFMRTFVPWQMWRFVRLNMKMMGIIRRSHGGRNRPG